MQLSVKSDGDGNPCGGVVARQCRYDELAVQFERRHSRATYCVTGTLSGAFACAGEIAATAAYTPYSVGQGCTNVLLTERCDRRDPGPRRMGPTAADERPTVVVFGVFELPWGFQVSPIFEAATPRPYTLLNRVHSGSGYRFQLERGARLEF